MPRVGRVALRPLYATRDMRRAVVVDKALPTFRQQRRRDDVQLPRREWRGWRLCCCRLAGPRVPAGDVGHQAHWPRRHGSNCDGHHRGCQCRAVRWPVLPKSHGVPGEVPAGRSLGHHPAVRRVSFGSSALLLPLCCTVVVASSGGPCSSASRPCPGGRAGGAGCGKPCAPRRSGCVLYGFCRQCFGASRGRRKSWCRF